MSKLIKKTLKIEGMHCSSCAIVIDMDLEETPGVQKSQTSYTKQITEVEFDEEIAGEEDLLKVIAKSGYKAKLSSD